ncbi:MAG: molybdopterin-guanine dinucleotide biosynthesis protein B [Desulfosudaceae bacterium]
MKIIHIVGCSGSGKTTLLVELVRELTSRGRQVGTLKHSGHSHELEKPGKDSYRHRQAGGRPAAVVTTDQMAVFLPRQPDENPFDRLSPLFAACDIILVEGYIEGPGRKIEVWRESLGKQPLFQQREDILAVVTDDPVRTELPVWPGKDLPFIADRVLEL